MPTGEGPGGASLGGEVLDPGPEGPDVATGEDVAEHPGIGDDRQRARGQVVHADLPESAYYARLQRRLNGILPTDVRVLGTAPAPDGFDARFSALARRYGLFVLGGLRRPDPAEPR